MSIKQLTRRGIIGVTAVLLVSGTAAAWQINKIRFGGQLVGELQMISDYNADILPPPEYLIETYARVTELRLDPAALDAQARAELARLEQEYRTRQDYWANAGLPDELARLLNTDARIPADRMWKEIDETFLPAIARGDAAASDASYRRLRAHFRQHEARIHDAVAAAAKESAARQEAAANILRIAMVILVAFAAAIIAALAGGATLILRSLLTPLVKFSAALDRMAHGDFHVTLDCQDNGDEVGVMLRSLRALSEMGQAKQRADKELHTLLGSVAEMTTSVTNGSAQISGASDDLAARTEKQAATLEETSAAMGQLTTMVRATAASARDASHNVSAAHAQAHQGGMVVAQAVEAMDGIERSATEISQITAVIDGIAFQTNLLALNAGVEAARAGDAGKGFAVVATEVRALAQRSADASKTIRDLIEKSTVQVNSGVDLVGQMGKMLNEFVEKVGDVTDSMRAISSSAELQASNLVQINDAVREMDLMTQQNAAMVEETTAFARTLASDADQLSSLVSRFGASPQNSSSVRQIGVGQAAPQPNGGDAAPSGHNIPRWVVRAA